VLAVTLDGESKRLADPKSVPEDEQDDWPKTQIRRLQRLVGKERVSPELKVQQLQGKRLMETYRQLLTDEIEETLRIKNLGASEEEAWRFRQVFNFRYADGAQMMTVGWIIYQAKHAGLIDNCRFDANPYCRDGNEPLEIKVPNLTFPEMRSLDQHFPNVTDTETFDAIPVPHEDKVRYRELYRFFPTFTEADL